MKLLFNNINKFIILYVVTSFLGVLSELIDLKFIVDFLFKISSSIVVFSYYLKRIKRIKRIKRVNLGYVLVFLLIVLSDFLTLYDLRFFEELVILKFINTILFVWLVSEVLKKEYIFRILKYFAIYLISGSVVYFYGLNKIGYISILVTLTYVSTCLVGAITFVNLTLKNTNKALFYFIAVFLFSASNIVFGISYYVEQSMAYLPLVYVLRLMGMYSFYNFITVNALKRIRY